MKSILISILLITFSFGLVKAQGFLHTQGKEIVDGNNDPFILRGMGLGGWMLQEGYMLQTSSFASAQYQIKEKITELIGAADTEIFYDAWLENHVTKADIDSLKSWGFNSVRLPFHYNLFTLSIQEEPVAGQNTWLEKGFVLTDSLISWCAQNEMYVVLDMHAAPGGQGYDQAISDYNPDLPSIFESVLNQRKAASLWKRIAERYKDETWVAGYDLINEPNWDLGSSNAALKNVYSLITDSIRAVDQNHILFIEGNWFANDFNGLTPPWDDNMVYSPHKYWSINDQASIQWVLDMREEYDIPLYLGETGENSNVWFHDAVKLFDEHNIGWAWWPMKKIESIAGPLSVVKSEDYQTLLDYWTNGGTTPSASFAKATLMDLTEGLKIENCIYQKDVIDAMFRQQTTDETIPYNTQTIPGIVYPSDFDLGKNGFAYYDNEVANYQVSTGNYTSWNNGWIYRNDGVDLEASTDDTFSNGISVGWIGSGEWMQYDVDVQSDALYDVNIRIASNGDSGSFHFESGGARITSNIVVPNTNGWANWETITVENVLLNITDQKLRFVCDVEGFNLGGMEFVESGASVDIPMSFVFAKTTSENTIQVDFSKGVQNPLPTLPAGFEVLVNGSNASIISITPDSNNDRILIFEIGSAVKSSDIIRMNYDAAAGVLATDASSLEAFNLRPVQNNVTEINQIPGRIEAEDFFFQSGIQLENTSDIGGGQNIGYLDQGDYLDYYVDVQQAGTYELSYRTAAESEIGGLELQLIDVAGNSTTLDNVTFPSTGGWQTWQTTTRVVQFDQTGVQQMRILITAPLYNLNWLEFDFFVPTNDLANDFKVNVFPNPSSEMIHIQGSILSQSDIEIELINVYGQKVQYKKLESLSQFDETFNISGLPIGSYFLVFKKSGIRMHSERLVKLGD